MKPLTLKDLQVSEKQAFETAQIELLDQALALLERDQVTFHCFSATKGTARLANLLFWECNLGVEYLDGKVLSADQAIHMATHRAMDTLLGSDRAEPMLFGEAVASATDLYLVGKLSQAGLETDFLHDTLESFGYYFDVYGQSPEQLPDLLSKLLNQPFQTMVQAATFLFESSCTLLRSQAQHETLQTMAQWENQPLYPLLHHYNLVNWVMTARQCPRPTHPPPFAIAKLLAIHLSNESRFLQLFKSSESHRN